MKYAARPFGDPQARAGDKGVSLVRGKRNATMHDVWRGMRGRESGFVDAAHPFEYQGSADINTYKLFLEQAHALLGPNGSLGFLVPSGLYTDNGSKALRELFLERCDWTHLYAFQNERFVFSNIHHSFKMAIVHVRKGGTTESLNTRFRLGPGDSPTAIEIEEDIQDGSRYLQLPVTRIQRFSPNTTALLELRTQRDLDILGKLYEHGVLLGDQSERGWRIRYATEFHMTNDSKLFPPRPTWEARGYKPDEYGHWLKGSWRAGNGMTASGERDWSLVRSVDGAEVVAVDDIEDVALPLYQGRMLHIMDYSFATWKSGTGLRAIWKTVNWHEKRMGPQFLMARSVALQSQRFGREHIKIGFRDIARSTDERTMITALLPPNPCGHVVGRLQLEPARTWLGIMNFASFAFDWQVRERMGGTHLTWHILDELAVVLVGNVSGYLDVVYKVASLTIPDLNFAVTWRDLSDELQDKGRSWRRLWAITGHERLRLRAILDAVVAELYGLDIDDFAWILRDCDHPIERVCNKPFSRTLDPKGFWRTDKDKPPELRHPVLALVAFHELKKLGLDAFLALNDGDGWALPETLRLADYGLGHDERANESQPVAAALGPRFLDWQLSQDVAESWEECRRHAELIEKIVPPPERPGAVTATDDPAAQSAKSKRTAANKSEKSGTKKQPQMKLF